MPPSLRLPLAFALLAATAACAADRTPTDVVQPPLPDSTLFKLPEESRPVNGIWPDTVVLLMGDSPRQLSAEHGEPAGIPQVVPYGVTWFSSDPAVARVDDAGRVVAVGDGTATILAFGNGGVGTSTVLVTHYSPALDLKTVDAGMTASCALAGDGRAYCWGNEPGVSILSSDALGTAGPSDRCRGFQPGPLGLYSPGYWHCSLVPLEVAGGHRFTRISLGGYVSCGLEADGSVWCWGARPARVSGLPPLRSIAAGQDHLCGLDASGAAWCWDRSAGTSTAVAPGVSFTSLASGLWQTCGLSADGRTWCWSVGLPRSESPAPVPGPVRFTSVAVGWDLRCGLAEGGRPWCWKAGGSPAPLFGSVTLVSLTLAGYTPCGLDSSGTGWCWQDDGPHQVAFPGTLKTLEGNLGSLCAIRVDGALFCRLPSVPARRIWTGG